MTVGEQAIREPDFRQAKFDRAPIISGLQIDSPRYADWAERNLDLENEGSSAQDQVDKLRKLKHIAEENRDHEKMGQFFAMEMAAKRGTEITGFWPLLFT